MNTTLRNLILWAWNMPNERLVAQPPWLDNLRFNVLAKSAEANPDDASLRLMLRSLLTERFHLAVHTEARELPVYLLSQAKGGSRLRFRPASDDPGGSGIGSGRIKARNISMSEFAAILTGQVKRPVRDQTGLTGVTDVTLEWAPDLASDNPASIPAGPSIFTALQEQLGLKLEAGKAPVEVLVFDSADRTPSAN